MDEPQHQDVDASMADIRAESAESAMSPPEMSPPEAPPASTTMDSEEDSRTTMAGRKRDFFESTQYAEADDSIMSEDEPSVKRTKPDESSRLTRSEDPLVTNIASAPPVPAPTEEVVDMSHLPSVQESTMFSLLKNTSEEDGVGDVPPRPSFDATSIPNTWNAGVQSGLRTSFGSKSKGKGKSVLRGDAVNTQAESLAQTAASLENQPGTLDTAKPFHKLSKREEGILSPEEFQQYRIDYNVWLKETRLAKKANKIGAVKTQGPPSADQSLELLEDDRNDAENENLQGVDQPNKQATDDIDMVGDIMGQSQGPSTSSFRILSDREISFLSTQERIRYWDDYFDHQKAQAILQKARDLSFAAGNASLSVSNAIQHAADGLVPVTELSGTSDGSDSEDDQDDSDEEDDEDYSPYPNHEVEIETSRVPSAINDEVLAASGPAPVPPPPFKGLNKVQKNKLGKLERQQYKAASAAYHHAMTQYRIAKREYDAKLGKPHPPRSLPPNFQMNPKRLTKREVSELTKEDQATYTAIYEKHQLEKTRKLTDAGHNQAAKVLQTCKRWPLPKEYNTISASIKNGKTWYPSHKKGVRPYQNKNGTFKISQIFDNGGLPIPLQKFSFNAFVPAFLMENEGNWKTLDQRTLKASFNHYLSSFYYHVINLEPKVRSTADAPDAITLEDAKQQVSLMLPTAAPTAAVAHETRSHSSAVTSNNTATSGYADAEMSGQSNVKQTSTISASTVSTAGPIKKDLSHPKEKETITHESKDVDVVMTTAAPSAQSIVDVPTPTFAIVDDADLREALMFLQQKYYPSTSNIIRCLACAKVGHTNDTCPAMNCLACGVQGKHSTWMCPREMPCEKCRSRDHTRRECPEKLSLPRSEMSCDLCGSRDHLETACPQIWRSFNPSPSEIIVVSGIPVHCYLCGGADHYGPDCGLFRGGKILSGGTTWSKSNLLKYLDPSSRDRAISAGIDYSLPPKSNKNKNFNIKGKGKANDPITLDDSDDEQFLRPSVMTGNVPRGQIQFGNQGQPPVAPFRSAPSGQGGDITMSMRGPNGPNSSFNGGNTSERPKRGVTRAKKKKRSERRAIAAAAAVDSYNPPGRR
ncbi:hypothetical protein EG329_005656 [Mollisiaceae sp. DMI_Dod_QoI]|nr:hypothetical protein EG329_005656 [Helotiales sp. DMI_Dod_QoI]